MGIQFIKIKICVLFPIPIKYYPEISETGECCVQDYMCSFPTSDAAQTPACTARSYPVDFLYLHLVNLKYIYELLEVF